MTIEIETETLSTALAAIGRWSPNASLYATLAQTSLPADPLARHRRGDDAGAIAFGAQLQAHVDGGSPGAWGGSPVAPVVVCEEFAAAAAVHLGGGDPALVASLAHGARTHLVALEVSADQAPVSRELAHLLAMLFEAIGDEAQQLALLRHRVAITNEHMTRSPHLVGAAVVQFTDLVARGGDRKQAAHNYHCVVLDLGYLAERIDDPDLPELEVQTALLWLDQAYAGQIRVRSDPAAAGRQATLRTMLADRGWDRRWTGPRLGRLAGLYLDDAASLAGILRDLLALGGPKDAAIQRIHHRHGCTTSDLDFYLSAIGSFDARPILSGVQVHYDAPHEAVFAALRCLEGQT